MQATRQFVLSVIALAYCMEAGYTAEENHGAAVVDLARPDATHTISIWMPRSIRGPTPSLSISFNHRQSNGLVGVGWNLNAASSIDRCLAAEGQEANLELVTLSKVDRFCMYGRGLRLEGGSAQYGAPESSYSTAYADIVRVTAHGVAGHGPQYFVGVGSNGWQYEFGKSADSRVFPGRSPRIADTPVRWMLNKVSDRAGRSYEIVYVNQTGFAIPTRISWAETNDRRAFRYEARFEYFSKRKESDSYIGRLVGYEISNRHRLQGIRIAVDGVVTRKYILAYDLLASSARSRLVGIMECQDDSVGNCSPPVAFRYQ
jgi:hypothetical protein